jgi:ABC-type transport system involved in multi-copper enzyme maturation permease subunit
VQLAFHISYAGVFTLLAFITKSQIATAVIGMAYILGLIIGSSFMMTVPNERLNMIAAHLPNTYILVFDASSSTAAYIAEGLAVNLGLAAVCCVAGAMVFRKAELK